MMPMCKLERVGVFCKFALHKSIKTILKIGYFDNKSGIFSQNLTLNKQSRLFFQRVTTKPYFFHDLNFVTLVLRFFELKETTYKGRSNERK